MRYYEILPTHTETPRNTTRKIANLYIEFNYHFFGIAKKIPITFEQECTSLNGISHHIIKMAINYMIWLCASKLHVINLILIFCTESTDVTKYNYVMTNILQN